MGDGLLSVGLDVGTTTTQLIVSRLRVENRAGSFSVPEFSITEREILYKSPVQETPLLGQELVDGAALEKLVAAEYAAAGISREQVDTGAVIITGETSRKENARAVSQALSDYAGDFVVATAGPDLESVLAAQGSGAVDYARESGKRVLHIDIGGGTSNLALIENGRITATGCLNVGGRLLKWDENGRICYVSPAVKGLCDARVGEEYDGDILAERLVQALEMAAGLRKADELLEKLTTKGTSMTPPEGEVVISFSGGVADCIDRALPKGAFSDLGPALGQAIKKSRLCQGQYRLGEHTIRATVIGAGCYSTQLSGSTVYHRNISFPVRNLAVVPVTAEEDWEQSLRMYDGAGILYLTDVTPVSYQQVTCLAEKAAAVFQNRLAAVAMEADVAKAMGQCLGLRLGQEKQILCLDGLKLKQGDYLDVGTPVGSAVPVIVRTLIFEGG